MHAHTYQLTGNRAATQGRAMHHGIHRLMVGVCSALLVLAMWSTGPLSAQTPPPSQPAPRGPLKDCAIWHPERQPDPLITPPTVVEASVQPDGAQVRIVWEPSADP